MSSHVLHSGSCEVRPSCAALSSHSTSDEQIQITLYLRRLSAAPEPHTGGKHLSHAELSRAHGADPSDLRCIAAFADEHDLSIVRSHPASRSVVISGPVSKLKALFLKSSDLVVTDGLRTTVDEPVVAIPDTLKGIVVAALGLDSRPIASTCHRVLPSEVRPHTAQPAGYSPSELAVCYNFPKNTGCTQTIAIVELGGGYDSADLSKYWKQLGLPEVCVTSVSVDGANNAPNGDPNGADGEVVLDIEVAGAIAPGAKIVVYFAPNTDQGFLNAINAAIHDTVHKPSVISISWGSAENEWTPQSITAFDAAFHDAALLGITVLAASGDNGSSDGERSGRHVDFPASSPWVLACGGTRLVASNGKIQSETVWNNGAGNGATGGGVSAVFAKPSYQNSVVIPPVPGTPATKKYRGVPDIAAVADPETGYKVLIDGQETVIGGTSAVAPLWAGLIALFNQHLGHNAGFLHPLLYGAATDQKALHDIDNGTNGAYHANVGWDCCTGLGTPNGQAILNVLSHTKQK